MLRHACGVSWPPQLLARLQHLPGPEFPRNSMKVKVINRSEEAETRERSQDVRKVHRNLDPALHPFEKAKEYTRALTAGRLGGRERRACWQPRPWRRPRRTATPSC